MAKNKKSFVLYADLIGRVEHLTNEEKGVLFQHLLDYVNDLNPILTDRILIGVWKPIEQQLKRDLKKFEQVKTKRSEAGKRSAEVRALKKQKQNSTNSTSVKSVQQTSTNSTVNDNVNVNVNEIIDKSITYNKTEFLKDWNELRVKHLKKPSFLNTLRGEDLDNFKDLSKDYNQKHFRESLIGLFKQNKLPNDSTSMQSNPKHFLKFFNTYLTAYHDKNTNLYGKKDNDARTN